MNSISISDNMIHPLAIQVCQVLHNHHYQAFIVGGCVRDLLLGEKPKDWDITSDAPPEKILEIFPKTIPTGLQHGTVTVCMGEDVENHFEVTTFRVEGQYLDGRRPEEVKFVQKVEEDLARRDLTINAIAYDPIIGKISDPYYGMRDLREGIIRAVGDPTARFQEDGLRIMRVARFAARFVYKVEEKTLDGMRASLNTLQKVSKERISDELCKTLMAKRPFYGFQILDTVGALPIACPLLSELDVSTLCKLDIYGADLETRLALLYSDFSPSQIKSELINLKLSNKEIKKAVFLLELLAEFKIFQAANTVEAYKSFIAMVKNQAPDTWQYTLQQFVRFATALYLPIAELLAQYRDEIVFSKKEMQLNGDDLLAAGIEPGPLYKKSLDICYSEILQYPEHNTKDYLLELAKKC